MKVGLISDIHLGYSDELFDSTIRALEESKNYFESKDVDVVVILGDLIHERNYDTDVSNIRKVYETLRGCYDLYAVAGNHDTPNITLSEFSQITETSQNGFYDYGKTRLWFADTAFPGPMQNIGKLNEEFMELVDQDLDKEMDNYLFTHYPLYYTSEYRNFKFFAEYPEGVFAINKHDWEVHRDSFDRHFFGHMHRAVEEEDWLIAPPTIDFIDESVAVQAKIVTLK